MAKFCNMCRESAIPDCALCAFSRFHNGKSIPSSLPAGYTICDKHHRVRSAVADPPVGCDDFECCGIEKYGERVERQA